MGTQIERPRLTESTQTPGRFCLCPISTVACAGVNRHKLCEVCGHCWIRPGIAEQLRAECAAKMAGYHE